MPEQDTMVIQQAGQDEKNALIRGMMRFIGC
jgi:hypothetical protein